MPNIAHDIVFQWLNTVVFTNSSIITAIINKINLKGQVNKTFLNIFQFPYYFPGKARRKRLK